MSISLGLHGLCESIIDINKNIQSVTIISKLGRPIEKLGHNENLKAFSEKNEMLFMQCALEISMGKDLDEEYGPINYHLSERESSTMLSFPIDEYVVLVTTNKSVSPILLARKVVNAIRNYHTRLASNVIST
jgi:hypothetical protein